LFSGTRGSASTALAGSREGTGGISTRPAPSRPRADRPLVRRDLERELGLPENAPEAVPGDPPDQGTEPAEPEGTDGVDGVAAASPQVSQ
jgi:hypothetical protein